MFTGREEHQVKEGEAAMSCKKNIVSAMTRCGCIKRIWKKGRGNEGNYIRGEKDDLQENRDGKKINRIVWGKRSLNQLGRGCMHLPRVKKREES